MIKNRAIRILISTYHTAFLNPGGGEIELMEISEALSMAGLEVDIYGPLSKSIDYYDAVLHFGVNNDGLSFIRSVKEAKKRLLIWPNLWWDGTQSPNIVEDARNFFEIADKVILKSKNEYENNSSKFSISKDKVVFIPAAVGESFFNIEKSLSKNFKNLYGIDEYILWVGVFQRHKNQLELIKALKNIDLPIVFIGGNLDHEYYYECIRQSMNRHIFIPQLPHNSEILLGALSGCSIFVELTIEPAGLSALEAGAAGKKMLLVGGGWVEEQFNGLVDVVDSPFNHDQIRHAIERGLVGETSFPKLANRIKEKHSLSHATKLLFELLSKD